MSDIEADLDQDGPLLEENNAHQVCYVFQPFSTPGTEFTSPSKKRRKTKHPINEVTSPFPLLNHGSEPTEFAQIRYDTYKSTWARLQARIDAIVNKSDEAALSKIEAFIRQSNLKDTAQKLRTGLLVSGPDGGGQSRIFERWQTGKLQETSKAISIQLRASHCVNLQTTLKNIIKSSITSQIGQDGYQTFLNKHKRLIPMNFDLELLEVFAKECDVGKIVISVLDVETFDMSILSELFLSLNSWSHSIPFVLLLGIATTPELFESRLPKSAIQLLDATLFTLQTSRTILEEILEDIQNNSEQEVKFGPATIASLEELIKSQGVTVEALTNAIKYALMSHFFANSLSVLLAEDPTGLQANKSICTAIRNTPSFQSCIETLIKGSKSKSSSGSKTASQLLSNDDALLDVCFSIINSSSATASSSSSSVALKLPEATTINSRQLLQPFAPRPRHCLERALSKPGDYLACTCCTSAASASQPPSSILYVLLQEAGTVINVRDLYDAFCARAFPSEEQNDDNGKADRKQMTIFYAALAELKMLGLVKSSASALVKKRAAAASGLDNAMDGSGTGIARGKDRYGDVDFVAKTGWAGL